MPSLFHAILVKMLLLLACVAGVVGALVLAFVGLRADEHGELERILAVACVAMAAAGLLGLTAHDDTSDLKPSVLSTGDTFMLLVTAPLLALCGGVFVLTLLPSWYVILPVFAALWGAVFARPRPPEPEPEPVPVIVPAAG
jgi:hypothetical protein